MGEATAFTTPGRSTVPGLKYVVLEGSKWTDLGGEKVDR
jgi:hypothetical protein